LKLEKWSKKPNESRRGVQSWKVAFFGYVFQPESAQNEKGTINGGINYSSGLTARKICRETCRAELFATDQGEKALPTPASNRNGNARNDHFVIPFTQIYVMIEW
jgi:hypothetical protein